MNNPMPFMYSMDPKMIDTRITNLEKELMNLKNRIIKLENQNNNYSNDYQPNSYNMM